MLIDINKIKADPDQPRQYFDPNYLKQMEYSIRNNGILTNLKVEKMGNDFLIVDGECRYKTAIEIYNSGDTIANLPKGKLECDVFEPMSVLERNKIRFQLQEVFSSWSVIDKARAVALVNKDLELGTVELSRALGMSSGNINGLLSLLTLNPKLQEKVESKLIKPEWAMRIGASTKYFKDRTLAQQIHTRLFEMIENKDIANRLQLGNFAKAVRTQESKAIKNLLSGKPYTDMQILDDAGISEAMEEAGLRNEAKRLQTAIQRVYDAGLSKSLSKSTVDKLEEAIQDVRKLLDNAGFTL